MSWQDYVDRQLMASRCVTKAAIAGHDGNVWAKSDNFDVSSATEGARPQMTHSRNAHASPTWRRPSIRVDRAEIEPDRGAFVRSVE